MEILPIMNDNEIKNKVEEIAKQYLKDFINNSNKNDALFENIDKVISEKISSRINNVVNFYQNRINVAELLQKAYDNNNIISVENLLKSIKEQQNDIQSIKDSLSEKNIQDLYLSLQNFNNKTKESLIKTKNEAEDIKNDLKNFSDRAVNGALFSSFEERAKIYDNKAQKQEKWSIMYLWGLGGLSLCRITYFFYREYGEKVLLLNGNFWISLLFSALLATLLSILSYLSSNKYHMNKKLAEEYWHKASILKSFVGYKTQYQQNMEDAEYKLFFEHLVKVIMLNPADKINVFLNRKLPIETILETPKNIVDSAKDVAKNVIS